MFRITYHISPENLQIANNNITAIDIEYNLFPGDIQFHTDSGFIDMAWSWIPVLDFAISFKKICYSLSRVDSDNAEFRFTENDDVIVLHRDANLIEINPSFDGDTLLVNFNEFCNEVNKFYATTIEDIFNANSFLRQDDKFIQIIEERFLISS